MPSSDCRTRTGCAYLCMAAVLFSRQDLYNDIVQRPLVLSVRDAATENALIGGRAWGPRGASGRRARASLPLRPSRLRGVEPGPLVAQRDGGHPSHLPENL